MLELADSRFSFAADFISDTELLCDKLNSQNNYQLRVVNKSVFSRELISNQNRVLKNSTIVDNSQSKIPQTDWYHDSILKLAKGYDLGYITTLTINILAVHEIKINK